MKKIILSLCFIGIAYYSFQIYLLRNSVTITSTTGQDKPGQGDMRLKFTMTSDNVELMETCRKLFSYKEDLVSLHPDLKDEKKATLSIERHFPASDLDQTLSLNKRLQKEGCLKNESDIFAFEAIK